MDGIRHPARSAALGLWTTLALFTAVVASRRFAGAYTGPLPSGMLTIAVILAVAASLGALWLFRRHQPRAVIGDPALGKAGLLWLPEGIAWALPTLFSLVVAAQATSAQAGTLLAVAAIGTVILGVTVLETTSWWQTLLSDQRMVMPSSVAVAVEVPIADTPAEEGSAGASPSRLDEEEDVEELVDDTTTQWMTRRQDADGEAIEGTVRVEFAAGQREAVVHVTFCPPLGSVPEVEFECVDGEDWQIKSEAALSYGLRIQVRRSTMVALEQSGLIAYLATSSRTLKAA